MTVDLALIPARAGSIGVPGKNIADLGGAPLIVWTIRAALVSSCFKRVVVSTDGPDIAEVAIAAGAEVPFLRPVELATSYAGTNDVVRHALIETGDTDSFAILQPTSPFRTAQHIRQAVTQFSAGSALVSVAKGKPISWLFSQTNRGTLQRLQGSIETMAHRRQDAQPSYSPNGALYLCQTNEFFTQETLFPEGLLGFPMNEIDSLDIDEPEDLALARAIVAADLRRMDR